MRKFLIGIAAAVSTVALAAPASAQQWAVPTYRYQPYNFGYGFNGYNFARIMQSRVQRIRGDIRAMEVRRILSRGEARSLDNEARNVERRIFAASRGGIRPGEARTVENRIRRLEVRVAREASDWNRRPGHRRY